MLSVTFDILSEIVSFFGNNKYIVTSIFPYFDALYFYYVDRITNNNLLFGCLFLVKNGKLLVFSEWNTYSNLLFQFIQVIN